MLKLNGQCGIYARISLILVYISFFLVQFNIHFGGPTQISFFSSGYNTELSQKAYSYYTNKLTHKDSGRSGIKLNKRFHPQKHFTLPEPSKVIAQYLFRIQTFSIPEDHPLTQSSFSSPSLRGPPAVV